MIYLNAIIAILIVTITIISVVIYKCSKPKYRYFDRNSVAIGVIIERLKRLNFNLSNTRDPHNRNFNNIVGCDDMYRVVARQNGSSIDLSIHASLPSLEICLKVRYPDALYRGEFCWLAEYDVIKIYKLGVPDVSGRDSCMGLIYINRRTAGLASHESLNLIEERLAENICAARKIVEKNFHIPKVLTNIIFTY